MGSERVLCLHQYKTATTFLLHSIALKPVLLNTFYNFIAKTDPHKTICCAYYVAKISSTCFSPVRFTHVSVRRTIWIEMGIVNVRSNIVIIEFMNFA